ncbi:hypothetical protein SLEP1_g41459 [Rubroshorea leprosula]|uniref:SWIM-type domain-containing protein n=1 Tax=Rubroshorea leprosula TaxID=152421 RepID=A0AAV5L6K7_9ROSI|nr:hypothetical protein SLEP1_g41459 [Rubroshorea leprosula]
MSAEIIDIDLEGDSDGSGNEVRFLFTNLLLRCVKVMLNGWCCLVIVLVSDECSKKVGKVGFSNICLLTCFLKRGIWSPPYVFFMGQCVYLYGSNKGDWGIEKYVLFIHIGGRLIQDSGLKYVDGECWDWHVDIDKLTVKELFQKISIARYDLDMVEHIWYLELGKTLSNGKATPGDDANKGQETHNGSKGVETEGLTHGKGVDGEVRVEESEKESVVEDYYEPRQDFTAKSVWLEKEDEAGVEKEDEAGVEKERAGVNAACPNTPLTVVHDDGDEMQSDVEYSYISTKEDDRSDADHASRRRATHVIYEEVEDALLDIRRDIKWKKNDSKRIRAVCKHAPSCDWKILLSKDAVTDSWMVKTYIHEHTCGKELTSKRFNSTSASKYLVKKRSFASFYLKADDIFQTIRRNTGLELTGKQCRKAREKIARVFERNCLMEYSKLWDYAAKLRKRDPTATILIQALRPTRNANHISMRMYVCFSAMKLGFVAGYRRVIGVDGAFLKGAYKGVLLVAVGWDANDQMYSLAWAVVEVEKTETWRWFLEELQSDMQIGRGNRFTFISNQQKAFFKEDSKSDVVDNNMCEVFNGLIVDSRHKAIFSMLEDLRMMCGRRTIARRTFADEKFVGDFGPKIWEKIVASREGSKRCRVLWPSGVGYEVEKEDNGKFIVDINRRTCTCRCWNMTGMPCKHVISVIKFKKEKDEHYEARNNEASEATEATENLNDNNPVSQADNPASQVVNEERRPVQERRNEEKRKRENKSVGKKFPNSKEQEEAKESPPQEQNKRGQAKQKKSGSQLHTMAKARPRKGGQSGARE